MDGLSIWVVYDHPRDFPDVFVARRFENERPTENILIALDIDILRRQFATCGLVRLARADSDDPVIVETWI